MIVIGNLGELGSLKIKDLSSSKYIVKIMKEKS